MSLSLVDYGSSDSEDENQQQQVPLNKPPSSTGGGLGHLLPPPKNSNKVSNSNGNKKSIFYIPSVKDLQKDDDEDQDDKPAKRLKLGSTSTNLADLLPAPKNHQNPFRKPSTPAPAPAPVAPTSASTIPQKSIDIAHNDDKNQSEEGDDDDEEEEEEEEEDEPIKTTPKFEGSFFNIGAKLKEKPDVKNTTSSSITTTTIDNSKQQQEQLPVLEDPNAMYAYGADPNAYYQYYYQQEQASDDGSTRETLGNDALSQLGGKRRGESAGVNIIDVNQTELLPTDEWRRHAEAQQPIFATESPFDVNSLKKKKNNIMALAAQAKSMEHQLEERYAQERLAKAQARKRYGF